MPGPRGYDYANAARSFGQGLTYGYGDEIEAALRAAAQGDPRRYRMLRDQIRQQQTAYSEINPGAAASLEMAGMLGGAMLTPSMAAPRALGALSRALPRATPNVAKLVGNGLDAIGQGALYSAGQASETQNIPQTIVEEAPLNILGFGVMSGLGAGAKRLYRSAPVKSGINKLAVLRRSR